MECIHLTVTASIVFLQYVFKRLRVEEDRSQVAEVTNKTAHERGYILISPPLCTHHWALLTGSKVREGKSNIVVMRSRRLL
jgi:hypothetical protein